jgi:hydrogenase nickel incorporation protein HypA/HybF
MHEYSIVQALLQQVEAAAAKVGASAVCRIQVRIGELAGVEPDLLSSAYALCRERTVCANAELAIEPVAARWSCSRCDRPIAVGQILRCAVCGEPARLAGGDEILLERIEMEVP